MLLLEVDYAGLSLLKYAGLSFLEYIGLELP